jgi:HAE1 family hydrophobic/amphiphilic exporter-1
VGHSENPDSPEQKESGFNVSEFAIRRPVTTVMMIVCLLVVGFMSYARLPVEQFPDVSFPIVSISTTYAGASSSEMETLVSRPIEDGVSAINGIEHITSTSSSGLSVVVIEFKMEKNVKEAANEVQEKVALLRRQLPLDADEPIIARVDPNATPVLFYALSGSRPLDQLTDFARDELKPRLQKIDGVAEVGLSGVQEREVQVLLDASQLSQYHLSAAQVVARLQQENLDFPSGQIETNRSMITLRTVNSYKTAAQVGETPIGIQAGAQGAGKVLLLKDLGVVRDGFKDMTSRTWWNGKPAVALSIQKQSGTNTVEMAHRLHAEVERLKEDMPPGMNIDLSFDTAKFIEQSKDGAMEELIIGSLLAIVVIFIFLRTLRGTIIAAIAIPTSIISTYTFMALMGFTLNFMSLMALSLVVGVLVDDAVVDLENIFRHIEMGEHPFRAAINATNEIGLAVVATTFSIVAVFLPVGFMGGMLGKFFRQFGLTVAIAVLVSLVVARTLTPMLAAYFLKPMPNKHVDEHEAATRGIGGTYQNMLRWSLKHRILTVAAAFMVFVVAIPIAGLLPTGFAPTNDREEFSIGASLPSGSTLNQTVSVLNEVTRRIKSEPLIKYMQVNAGSSRGATDSGSVSVTLKSKKEGRREAATSVQARLQKLTQTIPGAVISYRETQGIDNGSGANANVNLALFGDNLDELQVVADQLITRLHKMPIVTDVATSTGDPRQEIHLRVDHRRAMEMGVTSAALAGTIRAASLGDLATQMRLDTKNVDVRVRLGDAERYDLQRLQSLPVMTTSGSEVPLGALAEISYETGPNNITRYDRERQLMIGANILPGASISELTKPLEAELKTMKMPQGVTYKFMGQAERMKDAFGIMGQAMLLAVLFIYLILASQFEHFIHPITIMMALPLSFAGAFLGLFLANKELGLMSLIGIIMLMGLVVKNSILLIDYILTLRKSGVERNEAVLLAGPVRLRPILMTTIAMVAGMMPVALQLTVGSETRSPMAVAVIGGLITSTLLTLLVVPIAYTLMDDLVNWLGRTIGFKINHEELQAVPARREHGLPPSMHVASAPESFADPAFSVASGEGTGAHPETRKHAAGRMTADLVPGDQLRIVAGDGAQLAGKNGGDASMPLVNAERPTLAPLPPDD